MKAARALFIVSLIVFGQGLNACSSNDFASNQSSEPPHVPAENDTLPNPDPTDTPIVQPQEQTDSEPIPEQAALSPAGPWVVYTSYTGVFISNPDGRGITMLHPFQVVDPYVAASQIWAAPKGGRVAVLELINMDGKDTLFPNLKIIKVPSGEVELELPLIPEDWEEAGLGTTSGTTYGFPVGQIFAAAGVWNKLTWSHDGTMLAFNAAIDGPSADLYMYHTLDRSVVRLTDGVSQSVDPVFTPDDQYILHGAVDSLNWGYSGGGYDYQTVWAAKSDNSGVEKVFDHEFYGYEHVLGWLSDTKYIAANSQVWCSSSNLRMVDLNQGVLETLFSGSHNQNAFAPEWDQVLFFLDDDLRSGECESTVESGVYLLDISTKEYAPVNQIDPNQIIDIFWHEQASKYFVSTESDVFYTVDPGGTVTEFQAPAERSYHPPLVSPDGARWVFLNSTTDVFAFGDQDGRYLEYEVEDPHLPLWTSSSTLVLFFAEVDGQTALLGSSLPGPRPILIAPQVSPMIGVDSAVLVNP